MAHRYLGRRCQPKTRRTLKAADEELLEVRQGEDALDAFFRVQRHRIAKRLKRSETRINRARLERDSGTKGELIEGEAVVTYRKGYHPDVEKEQS